MNEERKVHRMMERALGGEAGAGQPDLDAIVREGRRIRRSRRLAFGTAAAAVVAAGCVGWAAWTPQFPRSTGSLAPALAGAASSPAPPPADNSPGNLHAVHSVLLEALSRHLPAGTRISAGSDPTSFRLTHPDGSVTTIGALSGLQILGGMPDPCRNSRYTSDCLPVSLPDGSRGWASVVDKGMRPGWSVSVAAYTLDGQAFGLVDGDTESLGTSGGFPASPSAIRMETGTPLTEQQLIALVAQPDVLAALKKVPTDEVTPVPAGSPYRP